MRHWLWAIAVGLVGGLITYLTSELTDNNKFIEFVVVVLFFYAVIWFYKRLGLLKKDDDY